MAGWVSPFRPYFIENGYGKTEACPLVILKFLLTFKKYLIK